MAEQRLLLHNAIADVVVYEDSNRGRKERRRIAIESVLFFGVRQTKEMRNKGFKRVSVAKH